MKVIFIGAGVASLVAAEKLGKSGIEVEVYEKNGFDNLSYDWHDDVNANAFERFGLPMPPDGTYFHKKNWSFIPPSERITLSLNQKEELLDYSVERRALAQQYVKRAEAYAKFFFGYEVDKLIFDKNKITGFEAAGRKIYADIVVDNSGAQSKFRASLPKECGVQNLPMKEELFYAYRAFHKKADNCGEIKYTNKAYLKHMGEAGISWCIQDPSGSVNILIGRIGEMSKSTFDKAYEKLKASNPCIGDEVLRGGGIYVIPVRYPLTKMVADGYAAIGDSAFMTIPMLGSGIENSMNAACILSDVIINKKSSKKEDLWQYQVKYFELCGARHAGVDALKRWLLSAPPEDIDFLFEKGILSDDDMLAGATGAEIVLTARALIDKAIKGRKRLGLLLKLNGVLNKTKKLKRLGLKIPQKYDGRKIDIWQNKIAKTFYVDL